MSIEPLKTWLNHRLMLGWHPHMPNRHDMALRFEHITHNERFWLIVTLTILFGLLIFFAILGAVKGGGVEQPIYPHFPFAP